MSFTGEELVLESVTRQFATPDGRAFAVLSEVTWTVGAGETAAVLGPSGSGKSTLLNLIGGLDRPTGGRILVGATAVGTLQGAALAEFRATRVGFVFQEHHLLPQLTALENVLLPTLATGKRRGAEREAQGLLARVGLQDRMDAFPARLSGGERQRVALARALIAGARLLLCDEPTGNLDRHTGDAVVSLLLEVAGGHGATVIMVTHNSEQAGRLGRQAHLVDGRLVEGAEVAS